MFEEKDKKAYEAAAEAKMKELSARIDELQVKANLAQAEAKVKYQEQISALRTKHAESKIQFESLKNSAGNAWEEMKTGADSAWKELQVAFDKAKSELDA